MYPVSCTNATVESGGGRTIPFLIPTFYSDVADRPIKLFSSKVAKKSPSLECDFTSNFIFHERSLKILLPANRII